MFPDERRFKILKLIEEKGFLSLQEIVERVGTSESTVRRDLDYLDGVSQIRRTRGGAAYIGDSLTAFEDRRHESLQQKEQIAKTVAKLIDPGEAVLLDGGTTTLEVAKKLIGMSLHVVTNSVPIVNLLINQPNIELIVIGGFVYPKTGVALGPLAVKALSGIHVRRLIMSAGGITEAGLFNSNSLLVETERQMIKAAEEVVVVSDSGKLGHSALAHLCSLNVVKRLVVDDGISAEWQNIIQHAGVELTIADG